MSAISLNRFREVDSRITKNIEVVEAASLTLARDLVEMKEGLWRESGLSSFKAYVEAKCIGKDYYHRLIKAGEFTELIEKVDGTVSPSSEWQLRPLVKVAELGEEAVQTVWQDAVKIAGDDSPTSSDVEQAVTDFKARGNGTLKRRRYTDRERELKDYCEEGWCVVLNIDQDHSLLSWAMENGLYVRVDRATKWGNPFLLGADGTRDQVCDAYAKFYWPHKPSLWQSIDELRGKVIGCHCSPERCHADHLAKVANAEVRKLLGRAQLVGKCD